MRDEDCNQNKSVYSERVDTDSQLARAAPARPNVDAFELLLRHIAYTLNQNQDTHRVLVWHFELSADDLEVQTSWHLGTAARLKWRHRDAGGVADALVGFFLAALDHLRSIWNELFWWGLWIRHLDILIIAIHCFWVLLSLLYVFKGIVSVVFYYSGVVVGPEERWVAMRFLIRCHFLVLYRDERSWVIFPREVFIFNSAWISIFKASILILKHIALLR